MLEECKAPIGTPSAPLEVIGLVERALERIATGVAPSIGVASGGEPQALEMPSNPRLAVYAMMARRRASTSSMIGSGTDSRRFPFRAAKSRVRG